MIQSIELQRDYWDAWNASNREQRRSDVSLDQREMVLRWLAALGRTDLDLIKVGCGAGWLCPSLKPFGRVTATDLSPRVLERASQRVPDVRFVAADFMALDIAPASFDVVVTLEVLSHVADHPAFVAKLNTILRPGGLLMLATQNRPVLERFNDVAAPQPGQLRRWFNKHELETLLDPYFEVQRLQSMTPVASKGPLRIVAGRKVKRIIRAAVGRSLEHALAAAGLGWTLMVLARKREAGSGAPPVSGAES